MTKRAIIPLVLVTTALLSGCTPNTDEAYTRCVRAGLATIDVGAVSSEEYTEKATVIAETCQKGAESDPDGFNEFWS